MGHRAVGDKIEEPANYWCERGDSNPHGFTRQILSLVRLPIPPLSHSYLSLLPFLVLRKLPAGSYRLGQDSAPTGNSRGKSREANFALHARF